MQHALTRHGRLDIAVPNAGIADVVPFEEQDLAQLRDTIDINLVAVMALAQLAGRAMLAAGSGSIVNVASILGLVAPGDTAMAGVHRREGRGDRRHARPGGRMGPARRARQRARARLLPDRHDERARRIPAAIKRIERRTLLGRVPRLDELDGALLFLASDASSYMTGQTLVIDGGWTAW